MKKYALIPILILLLASTACSLTTRRQPVPTPTPTLEPFPFNTAQPDGSATAPADEGLCPVKPDPDSNCDTGPTGQPTSTEPLEPTRQPEKTSPPNTSGSSDLPQARQPVEIHGTFTYTNEIITTYYVEHAVALNDLYGFVTRDREWEIPVDSQTLGFLDLDTQQHSGTFSLQLPARPEGTLVDVNPDGKTETGVQIFALAYSPNLTGGPYSEGDDRSLGWPSYLASTQNDPENEDEVVGGKLLIWSPNEEQFFPSGFGEDGLLFTKDDPVQPVPAGYSVVNLDPSPFALERDPEPEMTLYEPADVAVKDFSKASYSEAFDQMLEIARKEYAFNGITGKEPDWDALYAEIAPRVAAAEQDKDPEAFALALHDFSMGFQDGHVSVSGDLITQLYSQETAGGYGFAVRELDDGRVLVVYVDPEGPAARAGMKTGAVVDSFNGQPVADAIAAVRPWSGPYSTPGSLRYEQARFLVRAPLHTEARVSFTNPDESARSARLEAVDEQQSLFYTSPYRGMNPYGLPVEYEIFPNGVGYIKISSNYDDLNLIIRLFERALKIFTQNEITSLIIDMRQNSGGANLGLAGFLYDQEIPLGQLAYFSDATGQFEPEGLPGKVIPNQTQYDFEKKILIVGQACASACELEAYAFSQIPGMIVVGQFSTSGTEAEVARGQFELPEGLSLQLPTGRFTLPDGSLFLEGSGVQPTHRVPITSEIVLSTSDPILIQAYQLTQ